MLLILASNWSSSCLSFSSCKLTGVYYRDWLDTHFWVSAAPSYDLITSFHKRPSLKQRQAAPSSAGTGSGNGDFVMEFGDKTP